MPMRSATRLTCAKNPYAPEGNLCERGAALALVRTYDRAVVGRLIRTRRGYTEPGPPERCPAGHPLRGPQRVIVGTQQCATCAGAGGGSHRTYTCRVCGRTVYDPVPTPECSFVAFDGRAVPRHDV